MDTQDWIYFKVFSPALYLNLADGSASTAHIVVSPEDVTTSLGHTLFLSCVVVTNASTVTVTWRHNGGTISPSRVHVLTTTPGNTGDVIKSVLEVCAIDEDIAGNYTCMAVAGQDVLDEEAFHIGISPQRSEYNILV